MKTHDKIRSCATCKHHTSIIDPIPYSCIGCVQGGDCTKFEDAGGEENAAD